MSRFIETLCVKQGKMQHLAYHQQRVNRSRQEVLGINQPLALDQLLRVPNEWKTVARVKCRIVYSVNIEETTFSEYVPRAIQSLRLVTHDVIQYNYKFEDRRLINHLFAQRQGCDDILMVKNGLITDTSYSNVAFSDGTAWFTPYRPLLPGTARARLLYEGRLREMKITPNDLPQFESCSLINAMLPLGESLVAMNNIGW
ncbi:aminotransferase class IV [Tunicatimonas pelagia]|uniref:aminotransferase class IV n=1 Tax=Tunicatimonas pelagia TaxID=931531 RepID=UPI002665CE30|nr:aminotransferase class IV [Tunicatimonas pelagia]WKN40501.1 aminotransferase class IV [Tunicatimonas pelagia]